MSTNDVDGVEGQLNLVQKKLFTPMQIALVSLVGTPMSGVSALVWNYRTFDKTGAARLAALCGVLLCIFVATTFFYLPETPYDKAFPFTICFILAIAGQILQGKEINRAFSSQEYRSAKFLNLMGIIIVGISVFALLLVLLHIVGVFSLL